ncbi:hypothetical protein TNCV_468941 [Trichonephila clavipes]|nr:hypothetical protein TNCV_468941 [Trichonephila clavipes]
MGPGKRGKTRCRFQDLSDSICKRIEIVLQQGCLILVKAPKGVGKNEITIINMPKKKCALRKGVTKWPILVESVANWVLENHLNGLIVTRNRVRFYSP